MSEKKSLPTSNHSLMKTSESFPWLICDLAQEIIEAESKGDWETNVITFSILKSLNIKCNIAI